MPPIACFLTVWMSSLTYFWNISPIHYVSWNFLIEGLKWPMVDDQWAIYTEKEVWLWWWQGLTPWQGKVGKDQFLVDSIDMSLTCQIFFATFSNSRKWLHLQQRDLQGGDGISVSWTQYILFTLHLEKKRLAANQAEAFSKSKLTLKVAKSGSSE